MSCNDVNINVADDTDIDSDTDDDMKSLILKFYSNTISQFSTNNKKSSTTTTTTDVESTANSKSELKPTTNERLDFIPSLINSSHKFESCLKYTEFVLGSIISEEIIADIIVTLIETRGPVPVGEIGKLLLEMTADNDLTQVLKTKYRGLKKIIETYPNKLTIGNDHPFNPLVHAIPTTLQQSIDSSKESENFHSIEMETKSDSGSSLIGTTYKKRQRFPKNRSPHVIGNQDTTNVVLATSPSTSTSSSPLLMSSSPTSTSTNAMSNTIPIPNHNSQQSISMPYQSTNYYPIMQYSYLPYPLPPHSHIPQLPRHSLPHSANPYNTYYMNSPTGNPYLYIPTTNNTHSTTDAAPINPHQVPFSPSPSSSSSSSSSSINNKQSKKTG